MKRTVLRKRWVSGVSAVGQVVESEVCTTAPGGLLSRDFHAVSLAEFHLDTASLHRGRSQPAAVGREVQRTDSPDHGGDQVIR